MTADAFETADHLEGFQRKLPVVDHGDRLGLLVVGALLKTVLRDPVALEVLAMKPVTHPAAAAVRIRRKEPSSWKRATILAFALFPFAINFK